METKVSNFLPLNDVQGKFPSQMKALTQKIIFPVMLMARDSLSKSAKSKITPCIIIATIIDESRAAQGRKESRLIITSVVYKKRKRKYGVVHRGKKGPR